MHGIRLRKGQKFPTGKVYTELWGQREKVDWRKLFCGNMARPRAKIITWLACQGRLSTKDQLKIIGIQVVGYCCFCAMEENSPVI